MTRTATSKCPRRSAGRAFVQAVSIDAQAPLASAVRGASAISFAGERGHAQLKEQWVKVLVTCK